MEPGTTVGDRYRVLRAASTANTLTWIAEDLESGREVVLKALDLGRAHSWEEIELFRGEARVLEGLQHPGIPKIIGTLEAGASDPWKELVLVVEKVEGLSLATHLERGPRLGVTDVERLTRGLLDVLEYLHTRLPPVIHRDIKPSNIIVRPDGSPALIDFGGVRAVWRDPGRATMTVVGSVGYMPPEQYMGQVDPRSDLYALGATLLHVVTGVAPAEHDLGAGRLGVPEGLPLPAALGRLIDALLAPAPRDRPESAEKARGLLDAPPAPGATQPATPESAPAKPAGETPHDATPALAELGPAPRDPRGSAADVYRNLVPSFFALHRMGKGAPRVTAGEVVLNVLFLWPMTLGLVPLLGPLSWWSRRRRHRPLFLGGRYVVGRITKRTSGASPWSGRVHYAFVDHEGVAREGHTSYGCEVVDRFEVGGPIGLLHDPRDPSRNAAVYR